MLFAPPRCLVRSSMVEQRMETGDAGEEERKREKEQSLRRETLSWKTVAGWLPGM